jgi:hypothetical protein
MSIIRTDHNIENPYVMLNKTPLSDRRLSFAAKGLWAYLMSKKDNWQVSVAHLSKIFIGDEEGKKRGNGRDSIYTYLEELIAQGYCEKKGQSQNEKGQFSKYEYVIYEFKIISPLTAEPYTDEPDTDEPDTDVPYTVKQTTSNKRNTVNTETKANKEQQQQDDVVASSDKEKQDKLNELKKLPLSQGLIESSLKESLPNIKNAIECCLSRIESIKDVDAYFHDALKEKWQPKPSKEKIVQFEEEAKKQELQQQQKLYTEASQLILAFKSKLKEGFKISICDTHITLFTPKGSAPIGFKDLKLKDLKDFIDKHKKE